MTVLAERLKEKYFGTIPHPYNLFEAEVRSRLEPGQTLLDAGCGRTAPVLSKYADKAGKLIGVDLVDFAPRSIPSMELHHCDLAKLPVASSSVDVIMSRSVVEHLEKPAEVFREMNRVLRPGGYFIFLTPNLWDYVSLIALIVPNRFHPWIVSKTEGRAQEDVFPTHYRSNTKGAVKRFARETGFEVVKFQYIGQYPASFLFNGALFFLATGYEKLISRFDALGPLRGWIFATLRKKA